MYRVKVVALTAAAECAHIYNWQEWRLPWVCVGVLVADYIYSRNGDVWQVYVKLRMQLW